MITLIDFGAGNLKSAVYAFSQLAQTQVVEKPSEISPQTKAFILPGDGSFKAAFDRLKETGFVDFLKNDNKLPLLGICVGYQLLFNGSEEDGGSLGLGLVPGQVKRFPTSVGKIPHMGWNQVTLKKHSPVLEGLRNDDFVYFVHSYYSEVAVQAKEAILLETNYGFSFTSAIQYKNTLGFQFHPEKSHDLGRTLLANFVRNL